MSHDLICDIWINGEGPHRASGTCCRTLLESIGQDPVYFREKNNIITHWEWLISHDGLKNTEIPPEKPKKARISAKRLDKLQGKWAQYTANDQ